MRFVLVVLVLFFAALGALFGALNSENVALDFYFANLHVPKGAALLIALVLGWLLGGVLVYFGLVLRLRRRVRLQKRELARLRTQQEEHTAQATALTTIPSHDA